MSTNFPGSSYTKGFIAFSRNVGNLWGNPSISHILKYTIGWESNGKRAPMLWEKYEYQFPRLSPYHGFCCIFSHCWKFMGKTMHYPYDEVYHRMGIRWEKSTHTMGKVWVSVSQTFPISWVLLHFLVLWEIHGETHAFPIWLHRLNFSCVRGLYSATLLKKDSNRRVFWWVSQDILGTSFTDHLLLTASVLRKNILPIKL